MSKLGIIIKNYLKLICRNRVLLVVIVIGALLVVAALSNAFHTLLDSADEAGDFEIGYSMAQTSRYSEFKDMLVEGFAGQGIKVTEYSDISPEEMVQNGAIDVFVEFNEDGYHIFGNEKKEIQTRTVQYVLFRADMQMHSYISGKTEPAGIETGSLETIKTSSAENYYGIIEMVYFFSLCSVIMSLIFHTERKNNIGIRFRVGNVGPAKRYFAKLISCVLIAIVLQVFAEAVLVTNMFDVTIGKPVISYGLMILAVIAFAAFGLIFFILFDNIAVSIGLLFMFIWAMGFIGGSFETYMYSSFPNQIKSYSPLYYVNRSLVELSVNGTSDFTVPCMIFLTVMIVVCIPVGILLTAKKEV